VAKLRAAIRKALPLSTLILALAAPARGDGPRLVNPHGTTKGLLLKHPEWSAGVQAGNYGATGLTVQKAGFGDGALNLGLGLAHGSATLSTDYVVLLTDRFKRKTLTSQAGYNGFRGELNPFVGGGLQIGRGLSVRIPFGLQYTMLKDPFNFFGGAALLYGRFFTDDDLGFEAWFMIGARALL
jgi:hypothetical protein